MGLGTKNRQKQTADICKQHLREKYPDKLGFVEEFIVEIEGPLKNCDVTRWGQFTDIKDIKKRCSSASKFDSRTGSIHEIAGLDFAIVVEIQLGLKLTIRSRSRGPVLSLRLGG
jgi:hypothetical protein